METSDLTSSLRLRSVTLLPHHKNEKSSLPRDEKAARTSSKVTLNNIIGVDPKVMLRLIYR